MTEIEKGKDGKDDQYIRVARGGTFNTGHDVAFTLAAKLLKFFPKDQVRIFLLDVVNYTLELCECTEDEMTSKIEAWQATFKKK